VAGLSEPFRIPVGEAFIGRMVTALGEPCDQGGEIEAEDHVPVFKDSPPITHRAPVSSFLPTGTKIIDIFTPLAKGQRQLILGDRMTGKTVLVLDAMINQRGRDTVCIFCCIGKSVSSLEKAMTALHDSGALGYTAVLVATDSAPVGEQYLVPFAAASLAEHFAARGRDVLVVFDDLTKHAWAYRQLSLLLERPPGREAYPGDIFYVQVQLMERAGQFNQAHGGGSITFIGIAETLQGDLTGYIPSNLSSMCDGQICMSGTMFAEGVRPAIDFTLSLSIIGGRVQPPVLKALSRTLRADYARYVEVLRLSKLQTTVSGESERILKRGRAILGALQQPAHRPVGAFEQTLLAYALDRGWLDGVPPVWLDEFRETIGVFAADAAPDLGECLAKAEGPTTEIERMLESVLQAYRAAHEPEA